LGAPEPTKTASKPPSTRSDFRLSMGWPYFMTAPIPTIMSISSLSTFSGRRKAGMLERISPPGTGSFSKMVTS